MTLSIPDPAAPPGAVDRVHPGHAARAAGWMRCRDVAAGQEAVHAAAERYLPRLDGQSDTAYRAYRDRALFYNATARTIDGLSGMVFRKPPEIAAHPGLSPVIADPTGLGDGFRRLAEHVVAELLTTGRVGLLVDYPPAGEVAPATRAAAVQAGRLPYLAAYPAEVILDWRLMRAGVEALSGGGLSGGGPVLAHVLLDEGADETGVMRRRSLDLDPDGIYRQRIWARGASDRFTLVAEIEPRANGRPMTRIPFVCIGPRGPGIDVARPPLLDLVEVNLSHYRTSADLEHGAHYTGLPTAVITGQRLDDLMPLAVGAGEAWVLEAPEAKAFFLEFRGEGLGVLERLLDRKEAQMAALGARMLAPEKKVAEAALTAGIHRQGENSALAALAQAAGDGLGRALDFAAIWLGIDAALPARAIPTTRVTLNTDYWPQPMAAEDLNALVEAWQKGAIGHGELRRSLMRGEILPAGTAD
ncbi:DUF4055 domain-containing protein [Tistrella bauzanensis]|uniref:DUF4055 domain-containing protein n=1 Tax=Tistrella arctica TaxID=3133430 RepID=A0ABU9YD53_9PROT